MTRASAMWVVWRFAACTTLIVLAFAMAAPVMAISLQQAGYSTAAVGAFAMIPFALIALLIPVMPTVLARWGIVRAYQWGSLLQLGGALGYAAGNGLGVWSAASVASGMGAAALWNATEALLAREAPPERRGRVMGLYQTSLGAALALGPFVPALLGWGARPVLWAAAVMVVACCAIALAIPRHATSEPPPHAQSGTWHALRSVPALAGIAFTGGVFEAGLGSVSAAYASGTGLGLSAAASVAGAIGVGSFLCQYPAGAAADRFKPSSVFSAAALLLLAASLAFALVGPRALAVVGGGAGVGRRGRRAVHPGHGACGARVRGPRHRGRRGRDDHRLYPGRHGRARWPAAAPCSGAASPGWRPCWARWRWRLSGPPRGIGRRAGLI